MSRSLDMVALVADRLGDLRREMVFLGGAVTALLVTDPAAAEVRFTTDVDLIVDLATHADYARLSERLRKRGFAEDRFEGAPVCRWVVSGVKVDVMPTSASVLGFGNRWYGPAIENAEERRVGLSSGPMVPTLASHRTASAALAARPDGFSRLRSGVARFFRAGWAPPKPRRSRTSQRGPGLSLAKPHPPHRPLPADAGRGLYVGLRE